MYVGSIEVIVGTYEEFVLGYRLVPGKNSSYSLCQSFANHSHTSSIRCVDAAGRYLASGGADEDVHLYDMVTRKECGVLGHHNGTVNCLKFTPNGSHLLSGCDNGTLGVCRTGNWQLEKLWGSAHKGSGVAGLSIHPTGKLALSIGRDGRLRTWNLVKGRQAYATCLVSEKHGKGWQVNCVEWSPDGQLYGVAIQSKVDVYSMSTAGVIRSIQGDERISCIRFLNNDMLCLGSEGGTLTLLSVESGQIVMQVQAHEQRVKCVDQMCQGEDMWVASGSSNGQIKFWQYQDKKLTEICKVSTGCRITCLVLTSTMNGQPVKDETGDKEYVVEIDGVNTKSSKRKRKGVVVEEFNTSNEISVTAEHEESSSTKKHKKKHRKANGSTNSSLVVGTSGQKWIVEDL